MIDVSAQTLRNWEKSGKLIPDYKTSSGYRYYSQEQVDAITGNKINIENRITIGYCRVSSVKQKNDLERQVQNVKTYLLAQGKPFEIIEDIGSGINYNKKGLLELVIERYEAKEDASFYAKEYDKLEKKLTTIKNKRSKEYLETYKETAVQGDRMWKYLAVMLKTISRIDKLAEALADFTEEARIG